MKVRWDTGDPRFIPQGKPPLSTATRLAVLREALDGAELVVGPRANLLGLAPVIVPLEPVAALPVVLARVRDSAGVPVVGVDTAQHAAVNSDRVLNDHVVGAAVAVAVAAAADQLAVVLGVEVGDDDVAAAVELEDLVVGVEGAAAVDVRGAGLLLEGRGVLADGFPPNVVKGAGGSVSGMALKGEGVGRRGGLPGAQAVDALSLAGADDDVGEGGAVLEDEHGLVLTGLVLVLADRGCRGELLATPNLNTTSRREVGISWAGYSRSRSKRFISPSNSPVMEMGSEAVVSPVASGIVVVTARALVAKPAARMAVYFILKEFVRTVCRLVGD